MVQTIDRRVYVFFALILSLHAAVLFVKLGQELARRFTPITLPDTTPQMRVVPMTAQQWAEVKARQQIVQNDDTGVQEKPKDQAFLGEKDMTYDRLTIARKVDIFNKAGRGDAMTDAKPTPQQKPQAKKSLKDLSLSDIGVGPGAMAKTEPEFQEIEKKQGIKNGSSNSKGVSSTNDYIEHVALGDFTQLNTVEYKYYGFFHRIRQKLEQFWGNSLREKTENLYKAGRRLPASDMYTTGLAITMNAAGEITKVQVKSSSGVRELDDAAIESFNKAGPFPNPPQGLLVNGQATIEWGFVVKS